MKELLERLRAQNRNLEDDKAALQKKIEKLQGEIASLKEEMGKRLPISDIKDVDAQKIISTQQEKIKTLTQANEDIVQRLAEKDDSNAKIANLCNILLQDKSSLMEANKRLGSTIEHMQETIKALEESNKKLQERIEETRKALGLDQLTSNF